MLLKKSIKKTWRKSRIIRYRAYKSVGVAQHRKKIDLSLLLAFLLCVATFPFFISPPQPDVVEETVILNPEATETVHDEFGDVPVEKRREITLSELEKRVKLGELTLTTHLLDKGDSLFSVLNDAGVRSADRMGIVEAFEVMFNLKSLKPGMSFMVFQNNDGDTLGVSTQLDGTETFAVVQEPDGSWVSFSAEGRIKTETVRKKGVVERTFSGSAQKAGVPDSIVAQITGALEGEVDFYTDISKGDTFDVIYETKKTSSGLEVGGRQLVFFGISVGDKAIYRYAYTDKSGMSMFYDAKGRSGEKTVIKRPLKAKSRLSSSYGRRRHPILKYEIFHHGVDLAAPTGTPIMAGADGVITQLGRKGGYGKYIRIRHSGGYETAYGHLNGYRQDLKVGSKVKRGEVIGYVGSTGRSTGPHLHYEVIKNGKTVNPFGKNAIPSKRLDGFELEQFISNGEQLHPDFNLHRAGKIPPVPREKPFEPPVPPNLPAFR